MSERHKPHNGRDTDGRYKVRQEDVEDKLADPAGADFVRDDVRLGGAVEDTGPLAGRAGEEVTRLVEQNREDVEKVAEANADLPDLRSERGRSERGR
jgi:hypothetical protein